MKGDVYMDPYAALGLGAFRPGARVQVRAGHHKAGWKGTVRGADSSGGDLVIVLRLDKEPGPSVWVPRDLRPLSVIDMIGELDT